MLVGGADGPSGVGRGSAGAGEGDAGKSRVFSGPCLIFGLGRGELTNAASIGLGNPGENNQDRYKSSGTKKWLPIWILKFCLDSKS